jgi:hypothetical protein
MVGDAPWYEAATVVGITNALNVVADGLMPPGAAPLLPLVDEVAADPEVVALFAEIREFYTRPDVPGVFRLLAGQPGCRAASRRASPSRCP